MLLRRALMLAIFGFAWIVTVSATEPAPLAVVADVPLSGPAARFDYQSLDPVHNH